jgi:hypothetical protein
VPQNTAAASASAPPKRPTDLFMSGLPFRTRQAERQ